MNPEQEAERTILGAVLVDNRALHSALSAVAAEDFTGEHHAAIFAAMAELDGLHTPIDLVTLRHRLGGTVPTVYLANLIDGVPRLENVLPWAAIVASAARRRRLQAALSRAAEAPTPDDQIAAAAAAIEKQDVTARAGTLPIGALATASFHAFEKLAKSGGSIGISTGFPSIDRVLCGVRPGELLLIAARPGMGKSALASQVVRGSGARSLIVSLEMAPEAIVRRMIAAEAQVNQRAIQYGLRESQWTALAQASTVVYGLPVWINASANTVLGVKRAARAVPNLGLIVIDYLQLMEAPRSENRQAAVAAVSRGLKQMAGDLGVPIIALSQLSRPADQRKDKRPQLTDLRESGALEQDADTVLLIYREEAHNPTDSNRGRAEIIVAKQREGDTATVKLNWDKTTTRFFEDVEEPAQESFL